MTESVASGDTGMFVQLHVAIGAFVAMLVLVATTVTVVVVAARGKYDPPFVMDDKDVTYKTSPKDLYVLKNDQNPKGGTLAIISVTQPPYGKVEIRENGQYLRYTPSGIGVVQPHFAGNVTFMYEARNDKLSAWANVTVIVLNRPPEPVSLSYKISKNSVNNKFNLFDDLDGTGKKTLDLDFDELSLTNITLPPTFGTASLSGKSMLYTPQNKWTGSDIIKYGVTDLNDTIVATINLIVYNDAPKANPDTVSGEKNKIIRNVDVLKNDFDKNNDELFIAAARSFGLGEAFIVDGSKLMEYWPVRGQYSDSFEYTITDGELTSTSYATVQMLNSAPTAGTIVVNIGKLTANNLIPITYNDTNKFETLTITVGTSIGQTYLFVNSEERIDLLFEGEHKTIKWIKNTWSLRYTAANRPDYYTETFSYFVSDGDLVTTGSVTVNIINQAPIAMPDVATCPKNSRFGVLIDVLANDMDPNADPLDIVLSTNMTTSQGATVAKIGNQLLYVPAKGFNGTDIFSYTITDLIPSDPSKQFTSTTFVTVNVPNIAPVTLPDTYTIPRGTRMLLNLMLNDSDSDGDSISFKTLPSTSLFEIPLQVTPQAQIWYVASSIAPHTDSFSYTVWDGVDESNSSPVTINVINVAPVAINDDNVVTHWNSSLSIDVCANDQDFNPSDVPLLVVGEITQYPTQGNITISSNGRDLLFTPRNGFVGQQTIKYRAKDPYGALSNEAIVSIDVRNSAPVAVPTGISLKWGSTVEINILTLGCNDPDGDPIMLLSTTSTKAVVIGDVIKYTATAMKGVEVFSYTITDFDMISTANITVTITNQSPIANDDAVSLHWTSVGVPVPVLANDEDNDNDPLTITTLYGIDTTFGTPSINSDSKALTYVPLQTKKGITTFGYTVTDTVASKNATVTVTITNNEVPVATPRTFSTHWRTTSTRIDVVNTLVDTDGDSLAVTPTSSPSSGTASLATDSTTGIKYFSYEQAPATFVGDISWGYRIFDGLDAATSTISGSIVNYVPTAKNYTDIYVPWAQSTGEGITLDIINDATDLDVVDRPYLEIKTTSTPQYGAVTVSADKKSLKYVGSATDIDSFTFTITDGQAESIQYFVDITTGAQGLGAADKFYTVHWRNATSGFQADVCWNLTSVNDGKNLFLTSTVLQSPTRGSIQFAPEYVRDDVARVYDVIYTPNVGFLGTDAYIVQTTDSSGTTAQVRVTVTVTNTKPIAGTLTKTTHWRIASPITYDLLTVVSDPNADPVSITSFGPATVGTATWDSINKIGTYQPTNTIGTYTIPYTVYDGIESASGSVTIIITNNAPITTLKYGNVHWSIHKTGYIISNLLIGDSDPNTDPISLTSVGQANPVSAGTTTNVPASGATLTALANSKFVNNNVSFSYTVSDTVNTATGTVNLLVYDNAPISVPYSYTFNGTVPQSTFKLNVTTGCSDPDQISNYDLTLSIKSISYSGNSIVTINNNQIWYTPVNQFFGTETLTYIITDGMLDSAPATVTIIITNSAPIATPKAYSVMWNRNVVTSPLTGDTDPEENYPLVLDGLGVQISPISGTLQIQGNDFVYTPLPSITYSGISGSHKTAQDFFDYRVKDTYGRTSMGLITITVMNTPPVANNDSYTFAKTSLNPTRIFAVLDNDIDDDGDSLSVKTITYTSGNGASFYTNGTHIFYIASVSFRNSVDVFTYTVSDGQLESNPATISVEITNQVPTCSNFGKTVLKRLVYTWNLNSEANPQDPNGDVLSWSLPTGILDKATINITGSLVSFKSIPLRSGVTSFDYVVSDGFLSATCTATINITNTAPTAVPDTYTFKKFLSPVSFTPITNDYDVDEGDSVSIVAHVDVDNMINNPLIGGTLSRLSNTFYLLPNTTFQSPPSLKVYYTISDNDMDTPLQSQTVVNVDIQNWLPTVVNDEFSTLYGSSITINIADMLKNDLNPQGVTDPTLQFKNLVDCSTLDSRYYCLGGNPLLNVPFNGQITVPWSGRCQQNQFQYCINVAGDANAVACGTVVVLYTDCTCTAAIDVVYVLQVSQTTGGSTQVNIVNFIQNTINRLTVSPTGTNVGIVSFNTVANVYSPLVGNTKEATSMMSDFKKLPAQGETNIIAGLQKGIELAKNSTRQSTRPNPKVIVLLSDGLPTAPCEGVCTNCTCDSCGVGGTPRYVPGDCHPWDPTTGGHFCMPCADPMPLATQLNKFWKMDDQGTTSNWKLISYGFGEQLMYWNQKGWNLVRNMNYDFKKSLYDPWNDLKRAVPALVDAICNIY